MEVTFSSKGTIGVVSKVALRPASAPIITNSTELEPERAVSFSSKREIGGNVLNVPQNEGSVTFSSARSIGVASRGTNKAMDTARDAKSGLSFSSERKIGTFAAVTGTESETANGLVSSEEEEKAVLTATLVTFFVTFVCAVVIGVALGVFSCKRLRQMNLEMSSVVGMRGKDRSELDSTSRVMMLKGPKFDLSDSNDASRTERNKADGKTFDLEP